MTTARNLLYSDLTLALTAKTGQPVRERILSALDKYRVQMKPGINLENGATARESLFQEVMEKCSSLTNAEVPHALNAIFERYRMQTKQKLSGEKGGASSASKNGVDSFDKNGGKSKAKVKSAPLGGGPLKRTKVRGECPKCHSRGVVLAHSYAGDDYFSCIYCGFQAFKAVIETDLDLPLAAELLGRRFDEKNEADTEESPE